MQIFLMKFEKLFLDGIPSINGKGTDYNRTEARINYAPLHLMSASDLTESTTSQNLIKILISGRRFIYQR